MKLNELVTSTSGQVLQTGQETFEGVSCDTRLNNKNKIFFALVGENFDAHNFLEKAIESGAKCLVVHQKVSLPIKEISVVTVENTLKALQDFAKYWRHKHKAQILGITGTNGKTTTKDFAQTLISSQYNCIATHGNLNNFIGLPQSLLRLTESVEVGIFEMGLSVPNEMQLLTEIADPDIALVTTVGRAHLEGLGSLEAVAQNKEQIYLCARKEATRIFNMDNPYTKKMRERAPKGSRILTISSENPEADVHFKEVVSTLNSLEITGHIAGQPGTARLAIFGRHNILNLMSAAALAVAVGMRPDLIWKALPSCKGYWGRNQIVALSSGAYCLFDGYNANPESMGALFSNVSRLKISGRLFGVFGDMLELGEKSSELHREMGEKAAQCEFEHVWAVGRFAESFAEGYRSRSFRKNITILNSYEDSLALEILPVLKSQDTVLVKGSRGMKLERVVQALNPLDFSAQPKT